MRVTLLKCLCRTCRLRSIRRLKTRMRCGDKCEAIASQGQCRRDLQDTITTRDADQKYLGDLTATCEQKASDLDTGSSCALKKARPSKAIEMISSSAVSGNADKHLPSLLHAMAAALAQLRADGRSPIQACVAQYCRYRAGS